MSRRTQQRRWGDSESDGSPTLRKLPVQTTFRHMEPSPAVVTRITAEARKLLRYFDCITHCRVIIFAPHRHHRRGRQYAIHLELGVPGETLAITHEPSTHVRAEPLRGRKRSDVPGSHKDIYVVIRQVFDSARRRLEDHARRARGDMKHHEPTREAD